MFHFLAERPCRNLPGFYLKLRWWCAATTERYVRQLMNTMITLIGMRRLWFLDWTSNKQAKDGNAYQLGIDSTLFILERRRNKVQRGMQRGIILEQWSMKSANRKYRGESHQAGMLFVSSQFVEIFNPTFRKVDNLGALQSLPFRFL